MFPVALAAIHKGETNTVAKASTTTILENATVYSGTRPNHKKIIYSVSTSMGTEIIAEIKNDNLDDFIIKLSI